MKISLLPEPVSYQGYHMGKVNCTLL